VVIFEASSHARTARQGEGQGRLQGRPASIEAARVRIESPRALGATESAKALGISRANVYRVLSAGA
jgi:DNA-binding phage protein